MKARGLAKVLGRYGIARSEEFVRRHRNAEAENTLAGLN